MRLSIAVFNAETFAAAEYNLPWTDVCEIGGVLYGLTATGIRKLSGTVEATATPAVTTGQMNLSPGATCNVPIVQGLIRSATDLTLTATADSDGAEEALSYSVIGRAGSQERERTVQLARGPRGSAWGFSLVATGVDWSAAALSVQIDRVTPRR